MGVTATDIANRAIQKVGGQRIAAGALFTEDSTNASEVRACYDTVRRAELRRNPWRFAIRRATLKALTTTTQAVVPIEWSVTSVYSVNAIVGYQGFTYQSRMNGNAGHIPDPNSNSSANTYWQLYFGVLYADAWAASAGDTSTTTPLVPLPIVTASSRDAINPLDYGAFGDGTKHAVTANEVLAHTVPGASTLWIGSYTAGMSWDYIGVQEAFYAAFATNSTPGNIVWNSQNGVTYLNRRVFVSHGRYYIDNQLLTLASGFYIEFESRASTVFNWFGDKNTHMWLTDSISYGTMDKVSLACNQVMYKALLSIDYTGIRTNQLKVQQLTFLDCVIAGSLTTSYGIWFGEVGTSAIQGDTIVFRNLLILGFLEAGIFGGGNNTLGICFYGGDSQNNPSFGINLVGSYYVDGMSAQNQDLNAGILAPVQNQYVNDGADFGGALGILGNLSEFRNIRSEGDIPVNLKGLAQCYASNVLAVGGSAFPWSAGYPYLPGDVVFGPNGHVFMMVGSTAGTALWRKPTARTTTVVTDTTQTWTINQFAGNYLVYRYSNSFIEKKLIASNTANTITLASPLFTATLDGTHMYRITGSSHATTEPTWSTVANGHSTFRGADGYGFTTTVNSATITIDPQISAALNVGDFVMIPKAEILGPGVVGTRDFTTMLHAKVTAFAGAPATTATIDRAATAAVTTRYGYYGTPRLDNTIYWVELDFDVMSDCYEIATSTFSNGRLRDCGELTGVQSRRQDGTAGRDDFLRVDTRIAGRGIKITQSPHFYRTCDVIDPASPTLDGILNEGNVTTFTPTGDSTVTAPLPKPGLAQRLAIHIKTNGTSSYNITFGTNMRSTGVLATGTVSAKKFVVVFESDGETWNEVSRTTAM